MFSGGIPAQLTSHESVWRVPCKTPASQTITSSRFGAGGWKSNYSASVIPEQFIDQLVCLVKIFYLSSYSSACSTNTIRTDLIRYKTKDPPTEGLYWSASWRRASARCAIGPAARLSRCSLDCGTHVSQQCKRLGNDTVMFQRGLPCYLHPCKNAPPFHLRHTVA